MIDDLNIIPIEEGVAISDNIIKKFGLSFNDIEKTFGLGKVSSFAGIVYRGDSVLVSFPKHYVDIKKFRKETKEEKIFDIRLLANSILEYETNPAYSSFRKKKDLNSNFSFRAYFEIYDYFQRYGLYSKRKKNLKKGYNGKISWRNTIKKSNKIVSRGNLLFSPFYITETETNEDFITRCMVFSINYTNKLFGELMALPNNSSISARGVDKRFLNNTETVISRLIDIRSRIFKDIDRTLIDNLILFFEGLNDKEDNVKDIKHYYFNNVWEKAVEKYLNNHFQCVKNNQLIFSNRGNNLNFSKKEFAGYNNAYPDNKLIPDHYFLDTTNDIQYIFDSKYYNSVKSINHKQFMYHILLSKNAQTTYNALIMPFESETWSELHLDVSEEFYHNFKIILTHLNTRKVLNNFISKR